MSEGTEDLQAAVAEEEPARRIPALAEALGYAGGGLALAAVMTLVGMFWAQLGWSGRTALAALVAAAAVGGGFALERLKEPAARRLSHFLFVVGVAALGATVGFATHKMALAVAGVGQTADEWAWFCGFLAAAVSGGLLWRTRRNWLQHLAFGVAVGVGALMLLPLIPWDGPDWGAGATLAFVGIVWGALTLAGKQPPESAGLTLASLGVLGGIQMMALYGGPPSSGMITAPWAVWLGFAVSIGLVVLGVLLRKYVMLGFGAAGIVAFAVELLTEVFDIGMGTPVALLAASVILICLAAYAVTRITTAEKPAERIATEVAGYAGVAFAVAGVMTMLIQYGEKIGTPGRIGVPAAMGALCFGAAFLVGRSERDWAGRICQALLVAGVAGVAASAGMAGYRVALDAFGQVEPGPYEQYVPYEDPNSWGGFTASLVALIAGWSAWAYRRGVLTLVAAGVACFALVTSGVQLVRIGAVPFWTQGGLLLAIGLVWIVLGLRDVLKPATAAIAVGCVLAILGTFALQNDPTGNRQEWSAIFGLVLALAAIGVSIRVKRGVLLGFGAAGVVIFSFMTVQMFFEGAIAGPIALLVAGVTFIAMAVLVAVVLPRWKRPAPGGPAVTA